MWLRPEPKIPPNGGMLTILIHCQKQGKELRIVSAYLNTLLEDCRKWVVAHEKCGGYDW